MSGTRTVPPPATGAAEAAVGGTYTFVGAVAGTVTVTAGCGALLVGEDAS
jgi:hypothetical protein